MATGFLNSLSSLMYVGQIFGVMPVLHRRRRERPPNPSGRFRLGSSVKQDEIVYIRRNEPNSIAGTVLIQNDFVNGIDNTTAGGGVRNYRNSGQSSKVNERRSRDSYSFVTQFHWKDPITVYSMLLIGLGLSEWACTLYEMATFGFSLGTIGSFNFYTIANFGFIVFFNLARKWSKLYGFWVQAARVFDGLPYRNRDVMPGPKILRVFCVWTLAAIVDTVLFRTLTITEMIERKQVCNIKESSVELIYQVWRSHIYHIFNFKIWHIPFLEIINLSLTFTWTYLDVFIMMISIGLHMLFKVYNGRIEATTGKRMPLIFWIEMRTHYAILRNLVEFVDQHVSILIMISFASNLYFICLQLFNSFTNHYKSWIHIIYFCNTLAMVIVRAMTVLKYAAGIASAAKRPLKVLRQIPTEFWNDELQRLFDLMSHDVVALSGGDFFTLTKSLFLVMVGTVATYELVIMDIHSEVNQGDEPSGIIC